MAESRAQRSAERTQGEAFMAANRRGSTFETVDLDKLELESIGPIPDYAAKLYGELKRVKEERDRFYERNTATSRWVLKVRKALILLGILALLATAASSAAKLSSWSDTVVNYGLAIALIAYALMTALSFYESATAGSAAYFRGNTIREALRDLWTNYEFDQAAILAKTSTGGDADAIKPELLATARALAAAMDTLARNELNDWRGEVQTSLTQLAAVGKEGLAAMQAQLKADYDARLAKLEEDAKSKAYLTLQVNGAAVGDIDVTIDEGRPVRTPDRSIALPELKAGPHQIRVSGKDKDGTALTKAQWLEVKAGIEAIAIAI